MQTFTFAVRQTRGGWVIDATTADGRVEQFIGLFTSRAAAADWIADRQSGWLEAARATQSPLIESS